MKLFGRWLSAGFGIAPVVEPAGAAAAQPACDDLIDGYCGAWSTADRAARSAMLDRVWDQRGTYTDPTAHVAGKGALNDHIHGFLSQYPGAKIVRTTGIDSHHDKLRFGWRLQLADGTVPIEGLDFCELSPEGKILHIVGFFGPLQAIGPGP